MAYIQIGDDLVEVDESVVLGSVEEQQALAAIHLEGIRTRRSNDLAETDWWATSDRTMTAEQTAYRQALRDITGQAGFPTNITWPTKPE
jgi:hypothetical protein